MTEQNAKKVGEVLAFTQEGKELFEKAHNCLETWISVDPILSSLHQQEEEILSFSERSPFKDVILQKAEKTRGKLRSMRDLYLVNEDDWKNPQEIMEWLGFFEGAAIIHWKLVTSFSNEDESFSLTSNDAVSFHSSVLENTGNAIQKSIKA